MSRYIVSYDEECIYHGVFIVYANSENEAMNKTKDYMDENNLGYHYWEDMFSISLEEEVITIK